MNHDIFRRDRDGHGGGVAIYIKDNIAYKRLYVLYLNKTPLHVRSILLGVLTGT